MEPAGILIGILIGIGGFTIAYFIKKRKASVKEVVKKDFKERIVEAPELNKAKRELKALMLEKELLSNAITRVYEAEAEGKITKEEREMLSEKYRGQLKSVNEKLGNIEVFIEVGELEKLRADLVQMLEQKIGQIDFRLQRARARLNEIRGIERPIPIAAKPPSEKKEKHVAKAEVSEVDEKVKKLRDEVLEALARLEQMDIEG